VVESTTWRRLSVTLCPLRTPEHGQADHYTCAPRTPEPATLNRLKYGRVLLGKIVLGIKTGDNRCHVKTLVARSQEVDFEHR
jgi:hypothetical protein